MHGADRMDGFIRLLSEKGEYLYSQTREAEAEGSYSRLAS